MIDDYPLAALVEPLQEWFKQNARQLPWRSDPTPYHVWISEIMLQQTRVEAVKPYYFRFLEQLPDVETLAGCPEELYLKLWEGLGYYSRVRNLHTAAQQIVDEYGGKIPEDYSTLLKIKGIGPYTAGAISSMAYGKPVAAVDGNVLRVLTRVTGDDTDISKQSFRSRIQEKLTGLMQESPKQALTEREEADPHIFNQALMELGAVICIPNGEPRCSECPWRSLCRAKAEGRITELPVRKKAKERRLEDKTVFVLEQKSQAAVHKRPGKGLLAGLYELPNRPGHLAEEAAADFVRSIGLTPLQICRLPEAKHVFSHVEWHMTGYQIRVEKQYYPSEVQKKRAEEEEIFFVDMEEIKSKYAIPSAFMAYTRFLK